MSTPINMIRRDTGGGGGGGMGGMSGGMGSMSQNDFLSNTDSSSMTDPKELMRQRMTEPSLGQPPQQLMHDMPLGSGMGNGMGSVPVSGMGGMPLQSDGMMRSDSQLVEDILKEMGESPGAASQSNINSQAYHYATDNSQIPPHKYVDPAVMAEQQSELQAAMNKQANGGNGITGGLSANGFMNQISFSLSGNNLKAKAVKNFKYPILVFIICFILGVPEFNRFLFSFFPKLLLESGQVSITGVALKSLVGMILFIIVAIFL